MCEQAKTASALRTFSASQLQDILRRHGAYLRGEFGGERADLGGANLYGANLYGANLRSADLYGANLYGADLGGANLYGANLYGANLYGASLYGANLRSANMYGANLGGANLYGANLYGADLRYTILDGVRVANADDSKAAELAKTVDEQKAKIDALNAAIESQVATIGKQRETQQTLLAVLEDAWAKSDIVRTAYGDVAPTREAARRDIRQLVIA